MADKPEKPTPYKPQNGTRILVNRQPKTVEGDHVSYEQIVELSGLATRNPNETISITYEKAIPERGDEDHGALYRGERVKVKDGTSFTVIVATDRA